MSYGCDLLFDAETAQKVRAEIEERTGQPCPCSVGRRCPLLPADLSTILAPRPERESA